MDPVDHPESAGTKLDAVARTDPLPESCEFGEDGTGWPLKFRTRGGGYYFNVGCSDLIADRKIRLVQATDIRHFVSDGLALSDGSTLRTDLVVLATGYKGLDHIVGSLFGGEVAARVGPIWSFNPATQELRNMWTRTKAARPVVHRRIVLAMPNLFALHRAADRRDRAWPAG